MKIKGKKVQKVFASSKDETFKKCLSAINKLGYSDISSDLDSGVIIFRTNFGTFNLRTIGDYLYRCSINNIGEGSSQCIIWCEECLDQSIPILEIITNQSCRYSQKLLDTM